MEKNMFSLGGTEQKEEGESAVQGVNCSSASEPQYGWSARQSFSHSSHNRLPAPEGTSEHPRQLYTVFSSFSR